MLTVGASAIDASPQSRQLIAEAYELAYDLRLDECLALLARARVVDPADPAPARAIASVTWLQMLWAQGVATFAAFEGTTADDTVARPLAPESLRLRFHAEIEAAIALAERARRLRDDVDTQYELGASVGVRALYLGTVEGRAFAAFTEGRRAVALLADVHKRAPHHRESALLPGIYRYAVSTLSLPKRLLAAAAGLPGDRTGGIALLERAAASQAATATDASMVLMIVYNREDRHQDALRHLRTMLQRHPSNRLLRLNLAATQLAAGDAAAALRTIDEGLAHAATLVTPEIPGERSLWLYIRGAARVLLNDASARVDLQRALEAGPREWVRARVHVELAKCELASGARARALSELGRAEHHARRAGDGGALAAARTLRDVSAYQ